MKVFIWERVSGVTERYHDDAGIVIFANTLKRAKELLYIDRDKKVDIDLPNYEFEVNGTEEEKVIIFPDAGCC